MSVVKFAGEYKVRLEFEVERINAEPTFESMQVSVQNYPAELSELISDDLGSDAKVTVTELSSYLEEA